VEGLRFPGVRYSTHLHRIVVPDALYVGPENHVYLTFDDGPHPAATPAVLQALRERGIRATFFVVGQNVERQQELASRIVSDGHTLGSHGHTHRRLMFQRPDLIGPEIARSDEAIEAVSGKIPILFRPPYGAFGPTLLKILRQRKKQLALWSLDTRDFTARDPDAFVAETYRLVEPGAIVLMHDNEDTAGRIGRMLPPLLDRLLERHLTFAALPT
jgi:peptidoglycan/xylan/chitin deacetylase (PgdA/CDA1 family)